MATFRKPKLRISKKGKISFGGGGLSFGNKKAKVNISQSGVSTSVGAGPVRHNSRRGWTFGCAMLLVIGLSFAILSFTAAHITLAQNQTATATPQQFKVTALKTANLRAGPATTFAVVGSAKANQKLIVTGRTPKGDWYQLADGKWIAAFLVSKIIGDPPIVTNSTLTTSTPASLATMSDAAPIVATPAAPITNNGGSQAFQCVGGCSSAPDPSCVIKGNVNSKKEKIYHMPGWRDYDRTDIKPSEGDRWFCTEQEATNAGFRAPKNH